MPGAPILPTPCAKAPQAASERETICELCVLRHRGGTRVWAARHTSWRLGGIATHENIKRTILI